MAADEEQHDEERDPVDRQLMNAQASEALSIFRIDLVVLALFASVIALIYRGETDGLLNDIFASVYTVLGITTIIGSMFAVVFVYVQIRLMSTRTYYKDSGVVRDEKMNTYSLGATAMGSVFAIFFMLLGVLEGVLGARIELSSTPVLFFLTVVPVIVIFDLLVFPEIVARYYGSAKAWAVALVEN